MKCSFRAREIDYARCVAVRQQVKSARVELQAYRSRSSEWGWREAWDFRGRPSRLLVREIREEKGPEPLFGLR